MYHRPCFIYELYTINYSNTVVIYKYYEVSNVSCKFMNTTKFKVVLDKQVQNNKSVISSSLTPSS